jgi:hypothetical protein
VYSNLSVFSGVGYRPAAACICIHRSFLALSSNRSSRGAKRRGPPKAGLLLLLRLLLLLLLMLLLLLLLFGVGWSQAAAVRTSAHKRVRRAGYSGHGGAL